MRVERNSAALERPVDFAPWIAVAAAAHLQNLNWSPGTVPPTGYCSGIRAVTRDRANSGAAPNTMMGLPSWYWGADLT